MATYEEAIDAQFLQRLRAYVRRRVPTEHDAEDVVQDVLVRLLHKGGAVAPESVRAWLFTVALNAIRDRWRRKPTQPIGETDQVAPEGESPNEAVAYLSRCMAPMLAALPPPDADLLRQVDVLDVSQAELARTLGVAASVVKSRIQRARRRLRALLEGCCSIERDRVGTPVDYRVRSESSCPCGPADGATSSEPTPGRSTGTPFPNTTWGPVARAP